MTKFTGEEFAKRLSEDKLKQPIVKIGMVKKNEGGLHSIWFVEGTACGNWIDIPVGLVEEVTFLRNVTCRDHEHALVQIQFKEPPATNDAAEVFAELARRNTQPAPPASATPGGAPGTIERRAGGYGTAGHARQNLQCVAYHEECGWSNLWIAELGRNVPIYTCWRVCDAWVP